MEIVFVGDRVKDRVSGFSGIAVARTEWLNGCVRITIQPEALHDGKPVDEHTFDEEQLIVVKAGAFEADEREKPPGGPRPKTPRTGMR